MATLTHEDLRRTTLRRQFPEIRGTGSAGVLELFDRLGPIQSQVPRAPFLAAAARLPGTTYETICQLFESFDLLKTSNLRGTVHTSTRRSFGWLDAVATSSRAAALRNALQLRSVTPAEVDEEVRRFCAADWTRRDDVVAHVRAWLAAQESATSAALLEGTFSESIIWGNSGLVRRPSDTAWEKRTDSWHRTARTLVPQLTETSPEEALSDLVREHLSAHGWVTRKDLSFFLGVGLTQVDRAIAALGDEVQRLAGPDQETYLDLAEPPTGGTDEPGLRLLGEFDALLLGFSGPNRTRFVSEEGLAAIWAKVNGLFKPVVLYDGRLVATWRSVSTRGRVGIEVSVLERGLQLPEDGLAAAAADVATVLGVNLAGINVLTPE